MNNRRAIILVMDSVGIGEAHDASRYADTGADTLGHIVEAAAAGRADRPGLRQGPLELPNLAALGLAACARASRGAPLASNLGAEAGPHAAYGYAAPASAPKGSTGGHWEIAGLPIARDWGYFGRDPQQPYPAGLLDRLIDSCGLAGVIEVGRASGTEVIARHGEAHRQSGRPIVYTSADSVLQIAAHEAAFGLDRLFEVCRVARGLCDEYRIARVIARPFVGESAEDFTRTENRRDFAMPPHEQTLLDRFYQAGTQVITIGKIGDLFAHRGISQEYPVTELDAVFDQTLASLHEPDRPTLIFVNFCDFDSKYGHRRDVIGYAHELERFDRRLPEVRAALADGDLLIVTADHGNDPTFSGSDHTREYVPVLMAGAGITGGDFGRRATFADIGATAARYLGLAESGAGQPIAVESKE
ncbi:phosphopentomutase [Salinisphaera sp.]|uniref:phosphopentomutase n=1 Tax=Salinisphaera sp. TaxID=1914330 RepID=UPI002D765615|nr:phosphopentomutase [Salinisphaera sp.]HET7314912.1 phosphopentomutase [Salinisphaera sp.]